MTAIAGRVDLTYRELDGERRTVCWQTHNMARHFAAAVDRDDENRARPILRGWSYRPCEHLDGSA